MKICLHLTLYAISSLIKLLQPHGAKRILAENLLIKQQLLTLKRNNKAPKLRTCDRITFGFIVSLVSRDRLQIIAIILKPETLLMFHKALVKRKYSKLYSSKKNERPGPKGPSKELIDLVVEMKKRNPRFGARRIAMQISNSFDITINKDVVLRILARHFKPNSGGSGPSWLNFIGHMTDSLWSLDFYRVESVLLKSHWIMVLMDQYTRRIIGFAVHNGNVDGITACCMLNQIISNKELPANLSSDNDPLFQYHRWKANLRVLGINEIKSIPQQPRSHPFVERLIRICRNELLDQVLFFNKYDLLAKLNNFQQYFNESRTHMGISNNTPYQKYSNKKINTIKLNIYGWKSHCRGLFQLPIAA
jgi:putative transposase